MNRKILLIVIFFSIIGFLISFVSGLAVIFSEHFLTAIIRVFVSTAFFSLMGLGLYFIFSKYIPEVLDLPFFSFLSKKEEIEITEDFLSDDFLSDEDSSQTNDLDDFGMKDDALFQVTADDPDVDFEVKKDLDDFGFFEEDEDPRPDNGSKLSNEEILRKEESQEENRSSSGKSNNENNAFKNTQASELAQGIRTVIARDNLKNDE